MQVDVCTFLLFVLYVGCLCPRRFSFSFLFFVYFKCGMCANETAHTLFKVKNCTPNYELEHGAFCLLEHQAIMWKKTHTGKPTF